MLKLLGPGQREGPRYAVTKMTSVNAAAATMLLFHRNFVGVRQTMESERPGSRDDDKSVENAGVPNE